MITASRVGAQQYGIVHSCSEHILLCSNAENNAGVRFSYEGSRCVVQDCAQQCTARIDIPQVHCGRLAQKV